ncbi:MAG: hypothetical protein U0263_39815 [Polyangiaceae bacterium]
MNSRIQQALRYLTQHAERVLHTFFVELDQDVVQDQRQRLTVLRESTEARQA